jgi:RNA polymerase sigma-70 factor (ECF subfamily)
MSNRLQEKFLLFRIRAKKDPDAFGKIYDLYVKQLYRFIYFKVSSAELAEDLTSETFLKAWQYLKEKRDVPHLQALLYSVARSVVIDHYRAAAHERGDVGLEEAQANNLTDEASERLLRDVETKFDTTRVIEKLRRLKDEYREVIVMKYLDELSTGEIASILGKSSANVRVILHRATKALSEVISHERQATPANLPRHQK